jgi:3-oxoadipate enol-lactonase
MASMIVANGIRMGYALEGPADAPVVMLSNSFLTDLHMWDPQMSAFTRKYRILRYDTRGHGDTEATPGPYSMSLLIADVVALLDALGIAKVNFVGLSMGGMIGQLFASQHPDRLLSLTLCDTACQMPPESLWNDRIRLAMMEGVPAFVKPMTERWLTDRYRKEQPATVAMIGAMIVRTQVDGLIGCAHAIKTMNHADILPHIGTRTLIVVGEEDTGTPVSASQFLHDEIKDSQMVVIAKAKHLPNFEQSEIFNRTVLDFLGRV